MTTHKAQCPKPWMAPEMRVCANCHNPINREVENAEEKLKTALTIEHGRSIYNAIQRKLFRSIDLCNYCYSTLRVYKLSTKSIEDQTSSEIEKWEKEFIDKYVYEKKDPYTPEVVVLLVKGYWNPIRALIKKAIDQEQRAVIEEIKDKLNNMSYITDIGIVYYAKDVHQYLDAFIEKLKPQE